MLRLVAPSLDTVGWETWDGSLDAPAGSSSPNNGTCSAPGQTRPPFLRVRSTSLSALRGGVPFPDEEAAVPPSEPPPPPPASWADRLAVLTRLPTLDEWTTAHPKIDPVTGECVLFGYNVFQWPYAAYSVIGKEGERKVWRRPIDMRDGPKMMHGELGEAK